MIPGTATAKQPLHLLEGLMTNLVTDGRYLEVVMIFSSTFSHTTVTTGRIDGQKQNCQCNVSKGSFQIIDDCPPM